MTKTKEKNHCLTTDKSAFPIYLNLKIKGVLGFGLVCIYEVNL